MIKRILVGLGGTPAGEVAVRRAIELAQIHDATLTAVTVLDLARLKWVGPTPMGASESAAMLRQERLEEARNQAECAIAQFETECRRNSIGHAVHRETGNPFEQMISHWRYHDLTVLAIRGLFDYGVLPEAQEDIVRMFSSGVRPIVAVSDSYRPVRRALIGYNGSMDSAKAMKRFIQMRPWPDVTVRIVCFEKSPQESLHLLDAASQYCRAHGYVVETDSFPGSPVQGLLKQAREKDEDILIMGNSQRSILMRKILGDTVLHTIRHADRPLFLSH